MHSPLPSASTSFWVGTSSREHPPVLPGDLDVDVAIIGGGITGITAALLLHRQGKRVAVLEALRTGEGVTGYTSAHLTEALDTRYTTLERNFGRDGARLAAEASRAAITTIRGLMGRRDEACDWRSVPGYLYTEKLEDLESLHAEYEAAKRAGLDVALADNAPLPFPTRGAVRFEKQAEFHPLEYLDVLRDEILAAGGLLFERTRVLEVHDGEPCRVVTEHGIVRARAVIVATNVPLNRMFLQTKIAHYRSYVLAARVQSPRIAGLFWDMDDPYHYLRGAGPAGREESILIVGGEDHKTGTNDDTNASYERLRRYAEERFVISEVGFRWSGQVIEPVDGLPFIGRNSFAQHVFVATGYSGNGLTFGTVAAMILSDQVLGRTNPWSELFEATRIKPLSSAKDFVNENVDVPVHLIGDRVRAPDARDVSEVAPGEGKIVRVDGKRLAVFRDDQGALHALSPICPHLGCHVHFNAAEKTWDCPCHGSRFTTDGTVLNGPAVEALAPHPFATK